jgi:hypothetical protein
MTSKDYGPPTLNPIIFCWGDSKRTDFAVCEMDGYIYALGGYGPDKQPLKESEIYSTLEDRWLYSRPMRERRAATAAAVCKGLIMVAGGMGSGCKNLKTVESYNADKDIWTKGEQMPRH